MRPALVEAQLPLAFPHHPAMATEDFLPHSGVRLALDMMAPGVAWPQDRLVVWGAPGVGKTHLLSVWARETGATLLAGSRLQKPFWPEGPVAIDDADRVPSDEALLHVVNAAAEARRLLVLAFSRPPSRCAIALPDLASRLRASMAIEIGPPDDAGLAALLAKLFSERQLVVAPAIQKWLLARLPRTAEALRDAVARLDAAALAAQCGVSRPLATHCLADLLVPDLLVPDLLVPDLLVPTFSSTTFSLKNPFRSCRDDQCASR